MAMDLQTLHTHGANFYQYVCGNPFTRSDPLGKLQMIRRVTLC